MKSKTIFIGMTLALVSQSALATYADDLLLSSDERKARENSTSTRSEWEDARSGNDFEERPFETDEIQREEEYMDESPAYEPIDVPVENQEYRD